MIAQLDSRVIEELFDAIVDLSPDLQREYLDSHCPDSTVRAQVERLVSAAEPITATAEPVQASLVPFPDLPGYQILEQLGEGGMAIAYKARQLSSNRLVAIKLMRPDIASSPDQRRRFFQEAASLKKIAHPHVVRVDDVCEHARQVFLVLELVEGGSLAKRLNGKPWEAKDAAKLIEVLARTMEFVHKHHIIHRDLKPGNVLLTPDDHLPKVADFGLAKLLGNERALTIDTLEATGSNRHTLSGAILGTPYYMAPEQATGQNKLVGPATDIYALGAILFELLTGHPPFDAETPLALLEKVRDTPAAFPSTNSTKNTRAIQTICLKCLEKEPRARYASAGELADDLRHFRESRPIVARRPGPVYRLKTRCRRNPVTAALTVAVVGLVMFMTALLAFKGIEQHDDPNVISVGIWDWPGYAPLKVLADNPHLCEGLRVKLIEFPGGIRDARKHLKPRAEWTRAGAGIDATACIVDSHVFTRKENIDGKIVLKLDVSHGADGIVTTPDVTSLQDLAKKQVAYVLEEPPHFLLLALCQKAGLELRDIIPGENLRAVEPQKAGDLFADGEVDAAATWEPHLSAALKRSGAKIWKSSADVPGRIVDVLCVHESYLAAHRPNVEKLIRGWFRAVELLEKGDSKALASAESFLPNYQELVKGMRYSYVQDNIVFFDESSGTNQFQRLFQSARDLWGSETRLGVLNPKESDASHIFQSLAEPLLKTYGSQRNDPDQVAEPMKTAAH
jgi:ABC-type nitrate/sulfonate/bicarbonate transport system substrate-binding protein/tRNA A-37 threonylcarbamoyl transferase component Bud32